MTETNQPNRLAAWLETAWLERYLDRQLNAEEVAWFETYAIDKPDLLQKVDADSDLRDGVVANVPITANADTTIFSDMASRKASESDLATRRSPISRQPRWLALVASLIAGIGIGALAIHGTPPSTTQPPEVITNPARIIYDTVRGSAESDARIEHADSDSAYALIEVAVPPDARNIMLKVEGRLDQALSASPDGFVSFLLPRQEISSSRIAIIYSTNNVVQTRRIDSNELSRLVK